MNAGERSRRRGDRLHELTRTGPQSEMGKLLRRFWQPVAVSADLAPGTAQALRILSEDLTLYRGEGGTAHLVGGRCAHRLTVLHTGWVEGDCIRCMYHGWQYDGSGRCTQRPAERDSGAPKIAIAGYPLKEYAGLIFAYLGPGEPPAFDLPRKDVFERAGPIIARKQVWDFNWLQMVENSLDAVHVGFVHAYKREGSFIAAVTQAIPELDYVETMAGIRQTATRGAGNVRVSDWTFPNNNHISTPGPLPGTPWIDIGLWNVPVDDGHTARLNIYCGPSTDPQIDRRLSEYFNGIGSYNPAEHYDALFIEQRMPDDPLLQLTNAQDYVAQRGQGVITDRTRETLGRSDAGIALLRRILFRELDALRSGTETKQWCKLEKPAELPPQTNGRRRSVI
jgi:5,5'-dehydrodivanillate O-demethylase oxygenase subunit